MEEADRDVFGNIKQVNGPNPAGGADYVTTYTSTC